MRFLDACACVYLYVYLMLPICLICPSAAMKIIGTFQTYLLQFVNCYNITQVKIFICSEHVMCHENNMVTLNILKNSVGPISPFIESRSVMVVFVSHPLHECPLRVYYCDNVYHTACLCPRYAVPLFLPISQFIFKTKCKTIMN